MPEYKNFVGADFNTSVSTTIPYAMRAGTDVRLPFTRSDALAEENPSLDADVGMLKRKLPQISGIFSGINDLAAADA